MSLNAFVAELRGQLLEDLTHCRPPRCGSYSEKTLRASLAAGAAQLGSTHFEPDAVIVEFVFAGAKSSATVLPVRVDAPERIVFMPVPTWVVESIWQGDIDGTHHFESEAKLLVEQLEASLERDRNKAFFEPRAPIRRD